MAQAACLDGITCNISRYASLGHSANHVLTTPLAIKFSKAIAGNTSLMTLVLDLRYIHADSLQVLLHGIRRSASLTTLKINYGLTGTHCRYVAAILSSPPARLESITLGPLTIDDTSIRLMLSSIKLSHQITFFDISPFRLDSIGRSLITRWKSQIHLVLAANKRTRVAPSPISQVSRHSPSSAYSPIRFVSPRSERLRFAPKPPVAAKQKLSALAPLNGVADRGNIAFAFPPVRFRQQCEVSPILQARPLNVQAAAVESHYPACAVHGLAKKINVSFSKIQKLTEDHSNTVTSIQSTFKQLVAEVVQAIQADVHQFVGAAT